jgi:hypothetical protein
MSFQQKNVTVSLVSFSLILGFFLIRVIQMVLAENFIPANIFRLWGIVIALGILVTIFATILTHIVSAIIEAIKTGDENPKIEGFEDERDQLINLRGTKVAYIVYSIGVLLSMLTFVFGQPGLVMFTLLILFGIVAQIIGDISRLYLYRRGF